MTDLPDRHNHVQSRSQNFIGGIRYAIPPYELRAILYYAALESFPEFTGWSRLPFGFGLPIVQSSENRPKAARTSRSVASVVSRALAVPSFTTSKM